MRNTALLTATFGTLASTALATVSSTLVADTYVVQDGSRFYAVLDVYAKGNNNGDVMSGILGVNGHQVVFATSQAQGVTRDADGRVTGGNVTGDIFAQGDGSSWLPTNAGGKAWDSFIANGNRIQGASVTNRFGEVKNLGLGSSWVAATQFNQMIVANSNHINNGEASGWYSTFGNNPYTSAGSFENPFARLAVYNADWASTYPTLDRSRLTSFGVMQTGKASSSAAWASRVDPNTTNVVAGSPGAGGASLDFHSMIGRFAIDVTGKSSSELITMNVQFSMVGKNGISAESGTLFSGGSSPNSPYRVSQFFAFAVPAPGAAALLSLAGLMRRRRSI